MSPNPTPAQWRELLVDVPGSLGAVLQEVFASHDAEQAPRRVNMRNGAAVKRAAKDVHDIVFPRYSMERFALAVQPLLKPSMRAIADRADMAPGYLAKLISGERSLDAYKLQRIAVAARVSPAYFLEYRQMMVVAAVERALTERPEAGVAAFKAVMKTSVPASETARAVSRPETDRGPRGRA